ncbi:hypothetical protein HBI82_204080 [Parastagonospora nodorum]|nr:hypothetical protein HBI82_204080 [Parastagonospora nodorum]
MPCSCESATFSARSTCNIPISHVQRQSRNPKSMSPSKSLNYASLLPRLLPMSLANPLLTLLSTGLGITRTLQTHLNPLITRLVTQPDVASILALIVILFLSLKILDMMYRAVMFWINMFIRIAIWGSVLVVGLWVYNRGPEGFVEDVSGLAEFWMGEFQKYTGEVKEYRESEKSQIKMKAEQRKKGWR